MLYIARYGNSIRDFANFNQHRRTFIPNEKYARSNLLQCNFGDFFELGCRHTR